MTGSVAAEGALPPPNHPHQGLKALGTLDLIGDFGEGHGAPVGQVPPTMPLPEIPDSKPRGPGGRSPLVGGGPGEGKALTRATAAP
jgi:hypothetical protein